MADRQSQTERWLRRVVAVICLLCVVVVGNWYLCGVLSFDYLIAQESVLRRFEIEHPGLAIMAAVALYAIIAGLSIPAGTVLTLAFGWYFGFWRGLIVASFGSTAGAMIAFLLSRYLFRDWVQQGIAARLIPINEAFEREGAFYLFTLRLVIAVPFFVINAVMGLTKIKVWTFWWVSQLGMLPATAAYVFAGSTVPSLQLLATEGVGEVISWRLLFAFLILGLLPLAIKRFVLLIHK